MSIEKGTKIPDFSLTATSGTTITTASLAGRKAVIYFYPKDSTPGCTLEGQDFRDLHQAFEDSDTVIFGVSRDPLKSHENLKWKQSFPFELISDSEETLCQIFDVIKMKNMYGKQVRGIERSTFLIDRDGTLAHEWRKVTVKGHVLEVLEKAKALA